MNVVMDLLRTTIFFSFTAWFNVTCVDFYILFFFDLLKVKERLYKNIIMYLSIFLYSFSQNVYTFLYSYTVIILSLLKNPKNKNIQIYTCDIATSDKKCQPQARSKKTALPILNQAKDVLSVKP